MERTDRNDGGTGTTHDETGGTRRYVSPREAVRLPSWLRVVLVVVVAIGLPLAIYEAVRSGRESRVEPSDRPAAEGPTMGGPSSVAPSEDSMEDTGTVVLDGLRVEIVGVDVRQAPAGSLPSDWRQDLTERIRVRVEVTPSTPETFSLDITRRPPTLRAADGTARPATSMSVSGASSSSGGGMNGPVQAKERVRVSGDWSVVPGEPLTLVWDLGEHGEARIPLR